MDEPRPQADTDEQAVPPVRHPRSVSPSELARTADRAQRRMLLGVRLLYMVLLATVALLPFVGSITEDQDFRISDYIGVLVATFAFGALILMLDAATPNKRLASVFGVYLGIIAGLLAALAIGAVLAHFGVNLLAATAALGLGGFALSLAAKDTITNVISGIVIMFDSPFKIGDRIDVPSTGTWGDVVDIGIRSTRVLTRDNRLVIIPNASVVDGEVINYSQPDPSYRLQVDLGITYNGDIPSITKILEDTVRGVEGVMEDKPVNVLFTGFGDAGMDIRVRWWVKTAGDKRSVTHRVCAAIQDITVEKSIDMPNKTYSLVNTIKVSSEEADRLSQALAAPRDSIAVEATENKAATEPGAAAEKGATDASTGQDGPQAGR